MAAKHVSLISALALTLMGCDPPWRLNTIGGFQVPVVGIEAPDRAKVGESIEVKVDSMSTCTGVLDKTGKAFVPFIMNDRDKTYSIREGRVNGDRRIFDACRVFSQIERTIKYISFPSTGVWTLISENQDILEHEYSEYSSNNKIPSTVSATIDVIL